MMADPLVSIENVSKIFCRSLKKSLWYGVKDLAGELTGRSTRGSNLRADEFWALRDISFDVHQGDTIGLIGRNGAGKTTLLRLLNGLIKPDAGRITVRGRMQALIALGAGFNPVLTGRENIYVNAAVLGIPKKEVDKRFDEIVEFSGIGEFIDSPVQSYSSGMNVRLGFSVAVHMEPDILLVDEVLAVGDIPFRAKCHKKLGELKENGVPWIMVSHDMGIIRNQTNKVIYLEKGLIKAVGSPEETINQYLYAIAEEEYQKSLTNPDEDIPQDHSKQELRLGEIRLLDEHLTVKDRFSTGDPVIIEINYTAIKKIDKPSFGIYIYGGDGLCYLGTNTLLDHYSINHVEGEGKIFYQISFLPLLTGIYRIRVDAWDKNMGMSDKKNEAAYLHVTGGHYSPGMFAVSGFWNS